MSDIAEQLVTFFIFQAVMVLKDVPYRDGKLPHVKCASKYSYRIMQSN